MNVTPPDSESGKLREALKLIGVLTDELAHKIRMEHDRAGVSSCIERDRLAETDPIVQLGRAALTTPADSELGKLREVLQDGYEMAGNYKPNDVAWRQWLEDFYIKARAALASGKVAEAGVSDAIKHLTAELLRMSAKADSKSRKLVTDPTPETEASDFEYAILALEKYGDKQQLERHHGWLFQVKDGLAIRAAMSQQPGEAK